MIKTTYQCDKCKAETDKANDMWFIGVHVNRGTSSNQYSHEYHISGEHTMHVCLNCLMELGYKVSQTEKSQPEYKEPTLEDVIRAVVRQEIENQ